LTSTESNGELVRSFFDAVNAGDLDALDGIVADDLVLNERPVGRDLLKAFVTHMRGVFENDHTEILDLIAADDRVVVRLEATGTHVGIHPAMAGEPTHKQKTTKGIYIFRIADGKLAEAWDVWDIFGELKQLGLIEKR